MVTRRSATAARPVVTRNRNDHDLRLGHGGIGDTGISQSHCRRVSLESKGAPRGIETQCSDESTQEKHQADEAVQVVREEEIHVVGEAATVSLNIGVASHSAASGQNNRAEGEHTAAIPCLNSDEGADQGIDPVVLPRDRRKEQRPHGEHQD